MLAPLDNEVVFKKAFTDKKVFQKFIKDIFNIDITVSKIETEKRFYPKASHVDIAIDIYAETVDHRFIIDIQKVDYDTNFDRFLDYFITTITDQQKSSNNYKIEQEVLGVIVLCAPYKINQKNGEPIKDSVLSIDFNPRNLKGDKLHIWNHNLVYLNPHPNYRNTDIPKNYQDWLDLLYLSMEKKPKRKVTLNIKNKGIARAKKLISYENIDPVTLRQIKEAEGRRINTVLIHKAGFDEGFNFAKEKIEKTEKEKEQAEKDKETEKQRAEQAEKDKETERQRAEQAEKDKETERQRAEQAEKEKETERQRAEQAEKEKEAAILRAVQRGKLSPEEIAEDFCVDLSYVKSLKHETES
jgi:hypothetical protein